MLRDIKHALRTIRRGWVTSLVIIVSIGLGIGLNVTVFSLLDAILLRPVAGVSSPKKLFDIYTSYSGGMTFGAVSYPDYADWQSRNSVFDGMLAQDVLPVSLNHGNGNAVLTGALVSENYFGVLGVNAARGHVFTSQEAPISGSTPIAVISYGLWKRNFAQDTNAIGQTVRVNSRSLTIVGVAPPEFVGANLGIPVDMWIPMNMQPVFVPHGDLLRARGDRWLEVIGRLRPGVTHSQAQERMNALSAQLGQEFPDTDSHAHTTIVPLGEGPDTVQSSLSMVVTILMGCAALVLCIACFNVANLLLARASSRWGEMGLRIALGADRRVPISLLLTEGVLLCFMGGVLGVGLAYACTAVMSAFNPPTSVAVHLDLAPDRTVLLVAWLISLLCGLVVGIVPAIQAIRTDPVWVLKGVAFSVPRKTSWFRSGLVIAQVTVSVLLLVSAGLLIKSAARAQHADLGFNSGGLSIASIDVGFAGYDEAKGERAYEDVLQRVSTVPGVVSASLAQVAPLEFGTTQQMGIFVDPQQERDLSMDFNIVDAGYFRTLGIPFLQGRDFTASDREHSLGVVIVNEAFAQQFWKGQIAVGKEIRLSGPERTPLQVIGVVKNSKYYSVREAPMPFMFLPFLQNYQSGMVLQVRTKGDPATLLAAVREQVGLVDATIPVFRARTMSDQISTSLLDLRLGALLLGAFGGLALILAIVGLYAVVAYSVSKQTREIGVRIAMGAGRSDIVAMVLKRGARLALVGIVLGVGLSLPFGTLLASLLYGINTTDPVIMLSVGLLMGAIALIASFIPAWKAMRLNPVAALRYE